MNGVLVNATQYSASKNANFSAASNMFVTNALVIASS